MAEDIDFKYPMRRACAWEVATCCGGAAHGHARVIGCLQQNLGHEDMSKCVLETGGVGFVCALCMCVCCVAEEGGRDG